MNHQTSAQHAGMQGDWELDEEETQPNERGTTLRETVETVLFILLVFFILRGVVQNYRVEGLSMAPNFDTNQYLVVNKIIYFHFDANAPLRLLPGQRNLPPALIYPFRTPERGDVVIVEEPTGADQGAGEILIKRVIGLPGETIEIKNNVVYIDDQPLMEQQEQGGYLNEPTDCNGGALCRPYTIPPNHVVVLGDHRSNSRDSRSWSAEPGVPLDHILGKAWVSYWPPQSWGVVPTPSYDAPR